MTAWMDAKRELASSGPAQFTQPSPRWVKLLAGRGTFCKSARAESARLWGVDAACRTSQYMKTAPDEPRLVLAQAPSMTLAKLPSRGIGTSNVLPVGLRAVLSPTTTRPSMKIRCDQTEEPDFYRLTLRGPPATREAGDDRASRHLTVTKQAPIAGPMMGGHVSRPKSSEPRRTSQSDMMRHG
jgi:hypothetical protein